MIIKTISYNFRSSVVDRKIVGRNFMYDWKQKKYYQSFQF